MILITINKTQYNVPQCWNELNQQQLLAVFALTRKNYNEAQVLLRYLQILTGMNNWHFFKTKVAELDDFLYLVEWLVTTNNLTKQLLPFYGGMYGPADDLNNMVMSEFTFSEDYFMKWQEEKNNEELLNQFVAVLYRRSKPGYDFNLNPDGDCRIVFNENICAWHAKNTIAQWPLYVKLAIATYYSGCRQALVDLNPDVFGGSGDPAKYGLVSVMRDVAKSGTHGDFNQVQNMNVHLMMVELNEVVEEGKKLKQQLKQ